jgi:restriction system protein
MSIPKYDDLFNPLLEAMHKLGSSASISEQEELVASILNLSESEVSQIHKGNITKLSYNLAWARTYLKKYGLLDNTKRGVWILTSKGQSTNEVDREEVKKFVQNLDKTKLEDEEDDDIDLTEPEELSWEDNALESIKTMNPEAFERLCQRVLRESGFIQVEVTGKSGDGGIDGHGVVKLGNILSFHVHFQCKRYRDPVPPSVIRDFRGAMVGRADKGILITTSTFSRDARLEARRDGAPPLDLVDGTELINMLKDFRMGINVSEKIVEEITVDKDWFKHY